MRQSGQDIHRQALILLMLLLAPVRSVMTQENESPWNFGGFPIIFYSEETRWAFGAGGQIVHQRPEDPFASGVAIGLYYSQNKQYKNKRF